MSADDKLQDSVLLQDDANHHFLCWASIGAWVTYSKAIIDLVFYLAAYIMFGIQAFRQKRRLQLNIKQSLLRNGVLYWYVASYAMLTLCLTKWLTFPVSLFDYSKLTCKWVRDSCCYHKLHQCVCAAALHCPFVCMQVTIVSPQSSTASLLIRCQQGTSCHTLCSSICALSLQTSTSRFSPYLSDTVLFRCTSLTRMLAQTMCRSTSLGSSSSRRLTEGTAA
jgi:hypothetical protein